MKKKTRNKISFEWKYWTTLHTTWMEFKSNLIQIQLSSYSNGPNSKKLIEFKYIDWNSNSS
jgi:hypothetical protein